MLFENFVNQGRFFHLLGEIDSVMPIPAWTMGPFVLLLLLIATMPFLRKHWWEDHYPKVSVFLGALVVGYYVFVRDDFHHPLHTGIEFMSFLAIVIGLFVVSGGIHLKTKGKSTPEVNLIFLVIASITSNLIGTTGASMLFIRPWIRMNQYRITGYHIVFFIFIVSNVSGSLTPIGDPPLFLGYLKGIPFFWTTTHLFFPWLIALSLLLAIFYGIDRRNFLKAPKDNREKEAAGEEWGVQGKRNLIPLAMILGAVFIDQPLFLRETIMLAAAGLSFWITPKPIHEANHFNFEPVKEVGWLFLGIFATMMPALGYLQANAASFGINTPMSFYWTTGLLSGVLDNAPTYLTFLSACLGLEGRSVENVTDVLWALSTKTLHIEAISVAAVFFGAMTYIGNGPNLMVKAIAEQTKVEVPSFFGYLICYALPILLPVVALVGWIFFRS